MKPSREVCENGAVELLAPGEGRTVHEEVEAAERAIDLRKHVRNLRIVGDVAGKNQRVGQAGREIADVLLETLTLVGDRKAGTRRRRRLCNRPRNGTLVRDPDHETGLTLQVSHRHAPSRQPI